MDITGKQVGARVRVVFCIRAPFFLWRFRGASDRKSQSPSPARDSRFGPIPRRGAEIKTDPTERKASSLWIRGHEAKWPGQAPLLEGPPAPVRTRRIAPSIPGVVPFVTPLSRCFVALQGPGWGRQARPQRSTAGTPPGGKVSYRARGCHQASPGDPQ